MIINYLDLREYIHGDWCLLMKKALKVQKHIINREKLTLIHAKIVGYVTEIL